MLRHIGVFYQADLSISHSNEVLHSHSEDNEQHLLDGMDIRAVEPDFKKSNKSLMPNAPVGIVKAAADVLDG